MSVVVLCLARHICRLLLIMSPLSLLSFSVACLFLAVPLIPPSLPPSLFLPLQSSLSLSCSPLSALTLPPLLSAVQVCSDGLLLGAGSRGEAKVPAVGPVSDRVPCCSGGLRLKSSPRLLLQLPGPASTNYQEDNNEKKRKETSALRENNEKEKRLSEYFLFVLYFFIIIIIIIQKNNAFPQHTSNVIGISWVTCFFMNPQRSTETQ